MNLSLVLVTCFNVGLVLLGCQGGDDPNRFPPPNEGETITGSGEETSTQTDVKYYSLCEESGGGLVTEPCCNHQPYMIDTCDPDAVPCPIGGTTCQDVVVCDCGEGNCYSLVDGCTPIN